MYLIVIRTGNFFFALSDTTAIRHFIKNIVFEPGRVIHVQYVVINMKYIAKLAALIMSLVTDVEREGLIQKSYPETKL